MRWSGRRKRKAMSEWQAIETAPENKEVLVVRRDVFGIDRFEWQTRSEERLVRESGNRRTYEIEAWKEREWDNGWGWTHCMPLPAPPMVTLCPSHSNPQSVNRSD